MTSRSLDRTEAYEPNGFARKWEKSWTVGPSTEHLFVDSGDPTRE